MELTDIQKSLSEMSDEELISCLRDIRQNRRVSKKPPTAVRAKAAKEEKGPDLSTLVAAIPQDKLAALLSQMEAMQK